MKVPDCSKKLFYILMSYHYAVSKMPKWMVLTGAAVNKRE
jgi:hypothetical protein